MLNWALVFSIFHGHLNATFVGVGGGGDCELRSDQQAGEGLGCHGGGFRFVVRLLLSPLYGLSPIPLVDALPPVM